jgi:hypothetical protein
MPHFFMTRPEFGLRGSWRDSMRLMPTSLKKKTDERAERLRGDALPPPLSADAVADVHHADRRRFSPRR